MRFIWIFTIYHRATAFDSRVVGGPDADIIRFPYMAALLLDDTFTFYCSGSIIHVHWILTAAHCHRQPETVSIRVGSSYAGHDGQVHSAKKFIKEPNFDHLRPFAAGFDIALIKTFAPIKRSLTVQTVRLAKSGTSFPVGTGCMYSGYGQTTVKELDARERRLRNIGTPILAHSDCWKLSRYSAPTMICSGFSSIIAGICKGDSGGPLVCDGQQYGIASIGIRGCLGSPSGYVNVVKYLDWIQETMNNE